MKKLSLVISVLLLCIACSEDTDSKKDLIQLKIYDSKLTEYWVFASNQAGRRLDDEYLLGSGAITLQGNVSDQERINLFIVSIGKPEKYIVTRVFTDVLPGRIWQIGKAPSVQFPDETDITVTVGNLPESEGEITICQGHHTLVADIDQLSTPWRYSVRPYMSLSAPMMMSHCSKETDPVYYELEVSPAMGTSFDLDYQHDFKPFEHVVRIPWESDGYASIETAAIDNEGNYFRHSHFSSAIGDEIKLGFKEGFQRYYGNVWRSLPGISYSWHVFESEINADDFVLPTQDFTITNRSMKDFSFTNDWQKNIQLRRSMWEINAPIHGDIWNVYVEVIGSSRSIGVDITDFPADLIEAYPSINDPSQYEYLSSAFIFNNDSENGHDKYLEELFGEPIWPNPKTQYIIFKED